MLLLKAKNWSKKTLEQNLKNVYGLSFVRIKKICQKLGFQPSASFRELGSSQKLNIYKFIEKNIMVESSLKRFEREKKKFLENTRSIRGYRNKVGLPVRGQRTHTNGKTKRRLKKKMFNGLDFDSAFYGRVQNKGNTVRSFPRIATRARYLKKFFGVAKTLSAFQSFIKHFVHIRIKQQ